jgi:hypothetical protein
MGQKKFALQPLLEQRRHNENLRRGALAQAYRARDVTIERCTILERRCDAAGTALVRAASEGRTAEARAYDEMLGDSGGLRLRRGAEMRAHDTAIAVAAAALTIANRERRTLERLRERLEARRMRRRDDDD